MSLEEQVETHLKLETEPNEGSESTETAIPTVTSPQPVPRALAVTPETRASRSISVSSSGSSNGTPRRKTYHIAPVSVGGVKRSPRPSQSSIVTKSPAPQREDEVSHYMSQLATKEARVGELRERLKAVQLELQAAEFDLQAFKRTGSQLAKHLHSPRQSLARASTTDLQRGVREGISRSPSPQRIPQDSRVKRAVGEIGTQFWSFVEDVRTAALGDDEKGHRDPDPNQYL